MEVAAGRRERERHRAGEHVEERLLLDGVEADRARARVDERVDRALRFSRVWQCPRSPGAIAHARAQTPHSASPSPSGVCHRARTGLRPDAPRPGARPTRVAASCRTRRGRGGPRPDAASAQPGAGRGEPSHELAPGEAAHGRSSITWPVKTESLAPSRHAPRGRPAFSHRASSVCSTFQPCSGATCGRKSAAWPSFSRTTPCVPIRISAGEAIGRRGREDGHLDGEPRQLLRRSRRGSAGRAAPRRAPPARCRSTAGTSARAARCSRAARPRVAASGSFRFSVTKTPCRASRAAPRGHAASWRCRSSVPRSSVSSAARASRTRRPASSGGSDGVSGGASRSRGGAPRGSPARRLAVAHERHRDVGDRAVVPQARDVGGPVPAERRRASARARSWAGARASSRGRCARRSCSRSRAGRRGSRRRRRARAGDRPRARSAPGPSPRPRRTAGRTARSRTAGRSARSRTRRRRASSVVELREPRGEGALLVRRRCRRRGPARGRSGRGRPAGTAARSRRSARDRPPRAPAAPRARAARRRRPRTAARRRAASGRRTRRRARSRGRPRGATGPTTTTRSNSPGRSSR